ncbi:uncharacterized protein LOC105935015 isoform X1 [Fundulus heteroclitus]|uniref:uncharacterized protein LOC105935015 isoform X1 n=1 Tax=Fundulus heteroclitus TaxID=8078 RepID=UPI00165B548A|nr:uncharacterized protein LOC105935015 isoform X1 [Fundulus heteroclitus]
MGSGDTQEKSSDMEMVEINTSHEKPGDAAEGGQEHESRDGEGSPGIGAPSEERDAQETEPCISKKNGGGTTVGNASSTDHQDSKTKCSRKLDKKWVAVFLIAIILVVILASVYGCHAIHDNDDDVEIDRSTFTQQQNFSGSFQFLQNLSSCETQGLAHQEMLVGLYNSSPALERYFEKAETFCLRNDSAVVQYHLTFAFPEADETELKNFTLSWEMVYNVFRQYLYGQDPDKLGPRLIDPDSLKMYIVH